MVPYKKIKKCLKAECNKNAEDGNMYCTEHRLMKNNPKGYNKHKKNPDPVPKVLTQEETFRALDKSEQFTEIQQLGNKIWREGKELFKLKKKYNMMNKEYFGFKFEDEE